jgi:hypothetical protein
MEEETFLLQITMHLLFPSENLNDSFEMDFKIVSEG